MEESTLNDNIQEEQQKIKSFLRDHPRKSVYINKKIRIDYITAGESHAQKLVLLHGTLGSCEIFWRLILELKNEFHVLSLEAPNIGKLDQLLPVLKKFFDEMGFDNFAFLGTSYGGFVAQWYAHTYPEMITHLIPANTFTDNEPLRKANLRKFQVLKHFPSFFVLKFFKKSVYKDLETYRSPTFQVFMRWQLQRLSKKALVSRLNIVLEKRKSLPHIKKDIPILLLMSENDPLIPKKLQDHQKEYYSQAQTHIFQNNPGHFPYLTYPQEYAHVLSQFLKK